MLAPLSADPRELAERLLKRFGSISALTYASEADLRQCAFHGEHWVEAFLTIRQLLHDGSREQMVQTPLGGDRSALDRYLVDTMGGLRRERMIAIMADGAGFVISEEIVADGAEGEIQVSPRILFGRALALDERSMLIAHNHPSGCAEPSETDIRQTRQLVSQADRLGVCVYDHLVIGRRTVVSMRERGLL